MKRLEGYQMHLKLKGAGFPVKDGALMGGKADPYIRLWTGNPQDLIRLTNSVDEEKHTEHMGTDRERKVKLGGMHSSGVRLLYDGIEEVKKNTLDPDFESFKIQVNDACIDSDILSTSKSILIDFWDYDGVGMRPDFMGFVVVAPCELIKYATNKKTLSLVKGAQGHKWSGTLEIKALTLTKEQSEESVAKLVESLGDCSLDPDGSTVHADTHISVCVVRKKCGRCSASHKDHRLANSFRIVHLLLNFEQLVRYFTVPEGKMDEFKAGWADFYTHTREGTMKRDDCIYYGFTEEGNTVHCREGYKSADGVLKHLEEVLPSSITVAQPGVSYRLHRLASAGLPISEGHLSRNVPLPPRIFVAPSRCIAAFPRLSLAHRYHALLLALPCFAQVKEELDKAVQLVGKGSLNLSVMGPAAELEKLKEDLGPWGCKFYVLDSGGRCHYKFISLC